MKSPILEWQKGTRRVSAAEIYELLVKYVDFRKLLKGEKGQEAAFDIGSQVDRIVERHVDGGGSNERSVSGRQPPFYGFITKTKASRTGAADELSIAMHFAVLYEKAHSTPVHTGRYFVIFDEGHAQAKKIKSVLHNKGGFTFAHSGDFSERPINENELGDVEVLMYDDLGLALLSGEDVEARIRNLDRYKVFKVLDYSIVPEKVVCIPDEIETVPPPAFIPGHWGLERTNVIHSRLRGKGVNVAILDTGFDKSHPDFSSRFIKDVSFVPDVDTVDSHGHGTHCVGIACGSVDEYGVRYGVASESNIYVGKVLDDKKWHKAKGAQAWILNGIRWAVQNECKVISLSLGSRVEPHKDHDIVYEKAAKDALSKGSIIIAAAGNDSRRSINYYMPVSSPADCPSVLSVGAIDARGYVADFSNRRINPGRVNISAPGVGIKSSWPMPTRYRTISGTSMATPHVAGIAALLWEKYPDSSPEDIIYSLYELADKVHPELDKYSRFSDDVIEKLFDIDLGVGIVNAPLKK